MYCSIQDIGNRISPAVLAQLTNDTVGVNSPDVGVVNALIAKATSVINSYIADLYTIPLTDSTTNLPLTSVPDTINSTAIDLTCYYLWERRTTTVGMPASFQLDYKNACTYLEKLSNGELTLSGVAQISFDQANIQNAVDGGTPIIAFNDPTNPTSWF